MRRKLPSTGALEAFEAAARHQSFTKAAEELSVTQSAVCRQIAALESFLDVRLFRRTRRGVMLTEAGLDYSRSVGARLDEVERDTLELMARGGRGSSLELAVVPTFGTRWLLPRLPAFQRAHPHVVVHLSSRTRPFLFSDTPFDAAIHAGETGSAAWPGTETRFLMTESLIAVASPALAARAPADRRRLGDAAAAAAVDPAVRLAPVLRRPGPGRAAGDGRAAAWSCSRCSPRPPCTAWASRWRRRSSCRRNWRRAGWSTSRRGRSAASAPIR